MELVNVVKREREKKDLEKIIREKAPILLTRQGIDLLERLIEDGTITKEEKIFLDIKVETKILCLRLEKELKEKGYQCVMSISFIDKENKPKNSYGKYVHISGPNVPDEYVEYLQGLILYPFVNPFCRAIAINRVFACYDIEHELMDSKLRDILMQYGIQTLLCFPLHIANEIIGTFVLFSQNNLKHDNVVREIVQERIYDYEGVIASLQERWKNRNVKSWHVITSGEGLVHYVEEEMCEVLGYEIREAIGRMSIYDCVHPDQLDVLKDTFSQSIKDYKVRREAVYCKKKDGSYIVLDFLIIPCTNGDELRYIKVIVSTDTQLCKQYESYFKKELRAN